MPQKPPLPAPPAPAAGPPRRRYLVVLKHVLVAEDLAEIIAQFDPAAEVLRARSLAEGVALVAGRVAGMAALFLADERDHADWGRLLAPFEAAGTALVVIPRDGTGLPGDLAWPARATVLQRPFTTEMVLVLLARLARPEG